MTRPRALAVAGLLIVASMLLPARPVSGVPADRHCATSRPSVAYRASGARAKAAPLIPCRFGTGVRAMEPSFGFADGQVLFQGWALRDELPGGAPPYPLVVRSSDGVEWEDVSPIGHVTSLDPLVHVDPDTGRSFSVNFLATGQPAGSTISVSDDQGSSWITSPAACCGFDGQSIGTGPPVTSTPVGYPNLVYYCTGATPGSSPPLTTPICSKSIDGGLTFVPTGGLPYPLMEEEDLFAVWAGNPIVGPDGALYLPKRHNGQPQIAISHDEGATWTHGPVASNGASGQATRATIDSAGNVYYTWTGADHRPYLTWSRNGGRTWARPLMLAPPGVDEAALPRVAAGRPGTVAIAYLGTRNSPGPPYYEFCNNLLSVCEEGTYEGIRWNGYLARIDGLFARDPVIRTATAAPASKPLFVGGCSADGACKANLDFIDVRFDAAGHPWAAFVDDCALTRGFMPLFTQDTPPCGDSVGEGILVGLVPRAWAGNPTRGWHWS